MMSIRHQSWIVMVVGTLAQSVGIAQDVNPGLQERNPLDQVFLVQPDPNDRSELFALLKEPHIQEELGMKKSQLEAVETMIANQKLALKTLAENGRKEGVRVNMTQAVREYRVATENAIEEVLLPEQFTRLRQIAYRREVDKLGIARAIIQGRLAESAQLHDQQRATFYREATQILDSAKLEIESIKRKAEEDVLQLLVPEQRERIRKTIGPFFELEDRHYALSKS